MKLIDMTNWVMKEHGVPDSHWTVLEYAGNRKWKCQCDCINKTIKYINGADLRSGHSKSCGCYKAQKISNVHSKDITNQIYGSLTALYPTNKRQQSNIIWHCRCECGKEIDVSLLYLTNHHTTSCGCKKESQKVKIIKDILLSNNINFIQEKTFDDCKDKKVLPFDFYVNNSYLIEFDGEQHFTPGKKGSAWHDLEYYQKHDNIKNQWALQHNIPLIRIPYYISDITLKDLVPETSVYLVKE